MFGIWYAKRKEKIYFLQKFPFMLSCKSGIIPPSKKKKKVMARSISATLVHEIKKKKKIHYFSCFANNLYITYSWRMALFYLQKNIIIYFGPLISLSPSITILLDEGFCCYGCVYPEQFNIAYEWLAGRR